MKLLKPGVFVAWVLCGVSWLGAGQDPLAEARETLEHWAAERGVVLDEVGWAPPGDSAVVKAVVTFQYTDPTGQRQSAQGKLFVAPKALESNKPLPLTYQAGYTVEDIAGVNAAKGGMVLATPLNHAFNPIARGPGLDIALLHAMRSLPFVDDAKVLISGGSAGGYTTLMLAAETFPLAGAMPGVPPVNFAYNAAFFTANNPVLLASRDEKGQPAVPTLAAVSTLLTAQLFTFYPRDFEDAVWRELSPISHVRTITCPVTVTFSTGDVLVPIDQVSESLIRPYDSAAFPAGFRVAMKDLLKSESSRATLLSSLDASDYSLTVLSLGAEAVLLSEATAATRPPIVTVPVDPSKRWNIVVVDEGPMRPLGNHFQRAFTLNPMDAMSNRLNHPISPEQLTAAKLAQLMDRYSGRQWISKTLKHLDSREAERADVLRGLRTYVSQGEAHAGRLLELYARLPGEHRVLGDLPTTLSPEQVLIRLGELRDR